MGQKIVHHWELAAYKKAVATAMQLYHASKSFPSEEKYSLTDQLRRSSRSVCANLAEAWRKRRYEAAFISKLSDSESEAAETQVWIEFGVKCGYIDRDSAAKYFQDYDEILRLLVSMINNPGDWTIRSE